MHKLASITLVVLLLAPVALLHAEPVGVATGQYARPPQEAWKVELLKQPLRAYCIDFNWLVEGKHVFPEPGHWADADPAAHVKWYKDAGVTCIQTFVLSANGYAWYKGGPVPEQPGLKHDFLPEVVKLGHKERMLVMGYYCIGANTLWGKLHPEQSYGTPSWMHIPLTKEYIEYLCVSVEDALKKTGMDGFMLDWMVNTSGKWLDCEKTMYQELLGIPFPGDDKISHADLEKFNDLAIKRCWTRIRDTARKVKPDCILWPNGINHLKLEGVDWLLNEGPDVETTEAARKELNGRPVRLIQNQVGWSNHDARKVFCEPANRDKDFYGFAAPYDNSLPLPVAEYLKRPVADFNGTSKMTINDRNIAALIRFYLGKPVEPPPPWPEALRCEYLKDPLGIDVAKPRLSWKLETGNWKLERGIKQTAYQVLVASSQDLLRKDHGDLWDSGKVESDQSLHVEYAGKPLASGQRCFWKVRVWTSRTEVRGQRSEVGKNGDRSEWSEPSLWAMGLLNPVDPPSPGISGVESWSAKWITLPNPKRLAHPWLRRTFELKENVRRAMVYVNTASYYELRINGKKVGPYVLEPGITQVNKRYIVNTYDVTSYLVKGTNTIAVWMGPGWHQPRNGNTYNAPILRAQLSVVTPSGPLLIGTDASWRVKNSCISQIGGWKWNDFGGERFDAREYLDGWDQNGLDDSTWEQAREVPAPNVAHSWQGCESARLGDPVKPVEIRRLQNGTWVLDFGRPLTGWMRLKMHDLKVGQEVQIQYADIDNNHKERKLAFMVNTSGFQDFNQKDVFISAGKDVETFCSRFNFHSFRYAVIAGLDREPSVNDAEAMMIEPDLVSAGSFECSNELFNQIHEITRYTLRTQNPCLALGAGEAREKSAYGDGGAHLSGYLYNFTCAANLKKWIRDYSDAQRNDGWFPHTAPTFEDHGGGPAWGGQVSELVRRMHLYYGDSGSVEQMYDKLRKYVDFLESKTRDDILRSYTPTKREEAWMFIGDWARPAAIAGTGFNMDKKDEREVFNNAYRVLLWQQLQDFATGIGRTDEARRCGERLAAIRPLVHKTFYQQDKGEYLYSSQSSLAMVLYARIPPPELRSKIMAQLENMIVVEKKGHLDTGLLGTFIMLDLLIQENRNDLVDLIMGQTTYPSWGYLIKELGLKTWPETWSGWGSHVILVTATPGSWFYEGLGGILPDPANPGFKHFTLRPAIVKSVDWVTCGYDSPYGRIISNWKREGDTLTLGVTIPANTTATVYVPVAAKDAAGVTESGKPAAKSNGVKFLRLENGAAVYEVGSGTYTFQSTFIKADK